MRTHTHANPIITSYPEDDFQCVQDCANGVCDDAVQDKIQSHLNVLSFAQGQVAAGGCPPCPCPCPPCTVADIEKAHKAINSGQHAALPPGFWQTVIAFVMSALQQLLPLLFPVAPTPTPAP